MSKARIYPINIEEEMKTAYIDYSMSVIVARALPDVRDGLKPVHRRVLYGMDELSLQNDKPYKKSARIVGEVLGKYHPHGDGAVYDAMVRMAQPWSLRYPLVEGQGNFGSMDGDSPAAMRYTEAKMSKITAEMMGDLDKDTVDFRLNFDDSLEEPTVMPTKIPNLLINGSTGIAVGMATTMLPHNLSEICDAIIAFVDNEQITLDDLMKLVKGPDFPTGGIVYGTSGIKEYFETGRGRVVLRGKAEIQSQEGGREVIIITEIPYMVNKAGLIVKIAELINEERLTGISAIRDESDRQGLRIVIELKRDAIASVVLSKLYAYTQLQSIFGVNNIALVHGRPRTLSLGLLLHEFIKFRLEVIVRRTRYELKKAEDRAHILEGLLKALDHIDEIIALIRSSKTVDEARSGLISQFDFSEIQANAILAMQLQRLTGLEREKLQNEYNELLILIQKLKDILASEALQKDIVKTETLGIKEKYGDDRRTEINYSEGEINIEDLIPDDDVVITISHLGYIKRTKITEYRLQGRGGRGAQGSKTKVEDFIEHMFVASNHNYLLLFTEQGKCFWLRVFEIPEAAKTATGRAIQNLLNLPPDDKVKAYIKIQDLNDRDFIENHFIIMCTKQGIIKKTDVEAYSRPRATGINAITINEGDQLLEAKLTSGQHEIVIATNHGRAIRFSESTVRPMGRTAAGVKAITLDSPETEVIGMVCVEQNDAESTILVVSEHGNGKRSLLEDYPVTNRGGKGVKTMQVTDKTGDVVALKEVKEKDELMITCKSGITIRMAVSDMRVMGRLTQGVRLIRLNDDDEIADVAIVYFSEMSENDQDELPQD